MTIHRLCIDHLFRFIRNSPKFDRSCLFFPQKVQSSQSVHYRRPVVHSTPRFGQRKHQGGGGGGGGGSRAAPKILSAKKSSEALNIQHLTRLTRLSARARRVGCRGRINISKWGPDIKRRRRLLVNGSPFLPSLLRSFPRISVMRPTFLYPVRPPPRSVCLSIYPQCLLCVLPPPRASVPMDCECSGEGHSISFLLDRA